MRGEGLDDAVASPAPGAVSASGVGGCAGLKAGRSAPSPSQTSRGSRRSLRPLPSALPPPPSTPRPGSLSPFLLLLLLLHPLPFLLRLPAGPPLAFPPAPIVPPPASRPSPSRPLPFSPQSPRACSFWLSPPPVTKDLTTQSPAPQNTARHGHRSD